MRIDIFLGRLGHHREAVVMQPVDEGPDRGIFVILQQGCVIEGAQQLATAHEFLPQELVVDIEAEGFRCRIEVGAIYEQGKPVVNEDGTPKWRMAPSPHGPYWEEGMKLGYQDVGSWTLMEHTTPERRKAAWLYAQFTTSKTVSLNKTLTGLTPIRESDIESQAMTDAAPKLGGLVEFYRSPAREQWSPTGTNVPDYPKLAQLWWKYIAEVTSGESSAQQALDGLAKAQDKVMHRLQRAKVQGECGPKLNKPRKADYWLKQPGAPKAKLANEKPKGQTLAYDELLKSWKSQ